MIDLEVGFARYAFEVAMVTRCLDVGRPPAPYLERASHLLRQLVVAVRGVAYLPLDEAQAKLGDMLSFDPDLAIDLLHRHMGAHRACLQRLEAECLAAGGERLARYDLSGPQCVEIAANAHHLLDDARGVLWAVNTFGWSD